MKKCIDCQEELTSTNWACSKQKKHHYVCKKCQRVRNKKNLPKRMKEQRAWHRKLKTIVMNYYGDSECACCGENEIGFLNIDHINGGGNKHRKEVLGGKNRAGSTFYKWLINNHFPPGFRVLCCNCNSATRYSRICPHQLKLKVGDDFYTMNKIEVGVTK